MIDKRKMSKENMKNTWREIEIMKKIENHKNIVKLYQVLQTDDYLYLVTDYCEGGELFDYLDSNGNCLNNLICSFYVCKTLIDSSHLIR